MSSANFITAVHILGQVLVGVYFIYSGIKHFKDHKDYSAYASMNKVPMPNIAVYVTGILLILGGLGVLFNTYFIPAAVLLIIFLVPTSFIMHAFWKSPNPGERSAQKIAFGKNMAILGLILMLI